MISKGISGVEAAKKRGNGRPPPPPHGVCITPDEVTTAGGPRRSDAILRKVPTDGYSFTTAQTSFATSVHAIAGEEGGRAVPFPRT